MRRVINLHGSTSSFSKEHNSFISTSLTAISKFIRASISLDSANRVIQSNASKFRVFRFFSTCLNLILRSLTNTLPRMVPNYILTIASHASIAIRLERACLSITAWRRINFGAGARSIIWVPSLHAEGEWSVTIDASWSTSFTVVGKDHWSAVGWWEANYWRVD